jgi:mannose-6-phosphate isomerase
MLDLPAQPLLFAPHYHTRVWGGRGLESQLGRTLPDDQPYGESWELSDRTDCQSVVAQGPLEGLSLSALWTEHREEIFGSDLVNRRESRFPLLIKVLDCCDDLSIQVHPPAHLAAAMGGEAKSEMWHFVTVEPGSQLYVGLKRGVDRQGFQAALAAGSVAECVHAVQPEAGDSLMVHSGRLHALGAGQLVFEIQQNSDTTYRVFDWNRLGLDGQPRELHVEESLRCIDFSDVEPSLHHAAQGNPLAQCDHFTVERAEPGYSANRGFRMIMALEPLVWAGVAVPMGRVALWPACCGVAPDISGGAWLEVTL